MIVTKRTTEEETEYPIYGSKKIKQSSQKKTPGTLLS